MKHPLDFLPSGSRKPLFLAFLAWTAILLVLFQSLNRPLITATTPAGILSLQLAWSPAHAQSMLAAWSGEARLWAAFGLGFDYLFMAIYGLTLSLGTLLAAGRHPGRFAQIGAWMGWSAFLAALCDALENLGQWQQLVNGRIELALPIAALASLKFFLISLGLLYGLTGWLWKQTFT